MKHIDTISASKHKCCDAGEEDTSSVADLGNWQVVPGSPPPTAQPPFSSTNINNDESSCIQIVDGEVSATLRKRFPCSPSTTVSSKYAKVIWLLPAGIFDRHHVFLPTHAWCGTFVRAYGCLNGHERNVVASSCHKPTCPICYGSWAIREGQRATERYNAAYTLYRARGRELYSARHLIFSPPQEWAINLMQTVSGYQNLRKMAVENMKAAGLVGGSYIFHHQRQTDAGKWYDSPHFHVVAYGYLQNTSDFNLESGWIVKNIDGNPNDPDFKRDVFSTFSYLLTHCGLAYTQESLDSAKPRRRFQVVCWFGLLGNRMLRHDGKPSKVERLLHCETCGEILHEYDVQNGVVDWGRDLGFFSKKIKIHHFSVKYGDG